MGCVIHDQVQDDAHPMFVRAVEETLEVIERAIFGSHLDIIRNVIAYVELWRGEMRGEPERVNAKIRKIVKFVDHAKEVADAVAVSICKTARIDLVEHSCLPPFQSGH